MWNFKGIRIFCHKIKRIKLYPIIIILLSLLFLTLHGWLYELYKKDNLPLLLLNEIGVSLFILGSVTVLLELSDFREYFSEKLTDILIEDRYISTLDRFKLKEMENNIQKALYFKDHLNKENNFFNKVQKSVRPLIDDCYYNYYEIRVECSIEGEVIKKKIYKKYDLVNPKGNEIIVPVPIENFMQSIEGYDDQELYQLDCFNETTYENGNIGSEKNRTSNIKIERNKISLNDSKYDLKITCKDSITIKDGCIIEMVYRTITPLSDPHFLNRVIKPCKEYRCTFFFKHDRYNLTGYGFGFMGKNNFIRNPFSWGMEIFLKDWILPGDGVIFTVAKN